MKTTNSHDKYFKEVFSKKEEATAFLKGSLPKELVRNINFDSLAPLKDSYIDEELKENFSDLVFTCKYKGKKEIKIALLFEHKSKPVQYPHFQLLKYLIKLWDADLKQKRKPVPVIPIIFYHGKEKWDKKRFEEYFEGIDKQLLPFLPSFDYHLEDLSQYTDEEIAQRYNEIKTRTALLLMKNIFNEQLLLNKVRIIFVEGKRIINEETGEQFFTATFYYLFSNIEKGYQEITKEIETITEKGGDIAMTIAMQLREEGIKEGIKKGIKEGLEKGLQKGKYENQKETVAKLFTKAGFTVDEIAEYLDMDKDFVKKILKEAKLITK